MTDTTSNADAKSSGNRYRTDKWTGKCSECNSVSAHTTERGRFKKCLTCGNVSEKE